MDHFELLGLSCQFELDDSFLSSQFISLQRRFHPDKFAAASAQERLLAVQKAAQINDAYQTLKDPIRRAEYILLLNGSQLDDESQTMQDTEFLIQQMALREELEEIADKLDAVNELYEFEQKIQHQYEQMIAELANKLQLFQWSDAGVMVRKLKFLVKLKQEIERVEDQLLG